jgi:hypothetical protein
MRDRYIRSRFWVNKKLEKEIIPRNGRVYWLLSISRVVSIYDTNLAMCPVKKRTLQQN